MIDIYLLFQVRHGHKKAVQLSLPSTVSSQNYDISFRNKEHTLPVTFLGKI